MKRRARLARQQHKARLESAQRRQARPHEGANTLTIRNDADAVTGDARQKHFDDIAKAAEFILGVPLADGSTVIFAADRGTVGETIMTNVKADADMPPGEEMKKADAENCAKLDKLLTTLDSMAKRMDVLEGEVDPIDEDDDDDSRKHRKDARRRRKDDDEEEDDPEFGKARPLAADRTDSELSHGARMAEAQNRCDAVANQFGRMAPRPMDGEELRDYRVRLLMPYIHNSQDYAKIEKSELSRMSKPVFDAVERRVYADSMAASANPSVASGYLHEVKRLDATGRPISTFYGEPRSWMRQFSGNVQRVSRFNQLGKWTGD
jgi:hypothetical protein